MQIFLKAQESKYHELADLLSVCLVIKGLLTKLSLESKLS